MMEKAQLSALVKAMQAGDQGAFQKIYELTYQDIYYFIFKTVKERELAEDLTQDTFIKIMEDIGQLENPEAFTTWSRQVAYHRCTAYFRKRKELLADENEDGQTVFDTMVEENAEFIPHEALDREDLKKTILAMLDSLPADQRTAMFLRYYEELPVNKIAEIQSVSEGTVKSRLNYGRKAVRSSVEEYEKKHGIKLHSFAILPLLLWLLRKQKLLKGVAITAGAVGASGSAAGTAGGAAAGGAAAGKGSAVASTGTAAAGKAAAATATKGFLGTIGGKITAAVVAVAIAGGGVAAGLGLLKNKPEPEKVYVYGENTLKADFIDRGFLHQQVWSLTFTDETAPEGAEDVSLNGDGSVLMWQEVSEENPEFYDVYITSADGGPVFAPENSSSLFATFVWNDPMQPYYKSSALKKISLENLDTGYVTDMRCMFAGCEAVSTLDVANWDVSNVTDMYGIFMGCMNLQTLDVSRWDVSNVTDMSYMFEDLGLLKTLDVSNWDVSNVTNMPGMFRSCSSLEMLDTSGWDVSQVEYASYMFYECSSLESVEVGNWDTANFIHIDYMFAGCRALETLHVSNWNVSNTNNFKGVFYGCDSLKDLDVSQWDMSSAMNFDDTPPSAFQPDISHLFAAPAI